MKFALPWFLILMGLTLVALGNPACSGIADADEGSELKDSSLLSGIPSDFSRNGSTSGAVVLPGIYDMPGLLALIGGRSVGITTNHTGVVEGVHLVDTLLAAGVEVKSVFAPEHGFRGDKPDGERIESGRDARTGLPIHSLYGQTKKPTPDQMRDIEVMIFDIQDVGARFYTYISTLHYVMEAGAEAGIPVVVLDRPNPNIDFVDGPVLEPGFTSFVGMHPVPVVYGMTIGEYALMINGEGWLKGGVEADLTVVSCKGYSRDATYELPVAPSPNLPDMTSVYLYPSLCFFEGTTVSVGRGTSRPFTVIGDPTNSSGDFTFTPRPIPGASVYPKHEGVVCRGYDLRVEVAQPENLNRIDVSWLIRMYGETGDSNGFFDRPDFFDLLAGTNTLRLAILSGKTESEIRETWKDDLKAFAELRSKYLIYP